MKNLPACSRARVSPTASSREQDQQCTILQWCFPLPKHVPSYTDLLKNTPCSTSFWLPNCTAKHNVKCSWHVLNLNCMRPKGTEDRTKHQPGGKVCGSRDCFQTPLQHGFCTGYSNRSGTVLAAIGFLLTALLTLTVCLLHFPLKFNVLFGTLNLDYRCISFFLFLSFLKGGKKNQ